MLSTLLTDLDFIEELRLRRWARENYVPPAQRQPSWHPIVHEEMSRKELEMDEAEVSPTYAGAYR